MNRPKAQTSQTTATDVRRRNRDLMNTSLDSPTWRTYAEAMETGAPFIRLKLDIDEPVEIGDFVAAFLAVSAQYDRYVQREHSKQGPPARLFVREVRVGCIEADLVPVITIGALLAGTYATMTVANTVHEFVERWGGTIQKLGRRRGERLEGATKAELQTVMQQVAAVAAVPGARLELSAVITKNGKQEQTALRVVTSNEATTATENATEQRLEMEKTTDADHKRVLLRFTRTDTKRGRVGKKAVEHAVIEAISPRDLAVIYASELAEQRIRHEIVERDSVYWKGFVVDVNVEFSRGRPVAYRVMHVHDVIDLPDDDDA